MDINGNIWLSTRQAAARLGYPLESSTVSSTGTKVEEPVEVSLGVGLLDPFDLAAGPVREPHPRHPSPCGCIPPHGGPTSHRPVPPDVAILRRSQLPKGYVQSGYVGGIPIKRATPQAADQDICGGDDRTRTGDPLLAKHARLGALTWGDAVKPSLTCEFGYALLTGVERHRAISRGLAAA